MAKKIPLIAVSVMRNGEAVVAVPGKAFDFTKEELVDLDRIEAKTGNAAYRDPKDESGGEAAAPKKGAKADKQEGEDKDL